MTFRVEVVCLHDGGEQRCSVVEMERAELACVSEYHMWGIRRCLRREAYLDLPWKSLL
jgi:hypothetical protein